MQKKRIFRIASSIAILAVFILHTVDFISIEPIQRLENLLYDQRVKLTLPNSKDNQIVIIDLDDRSLAEIGRWPWSRNVLADMVDTLFDQYHIRVLGFDVVFAEEDKSSGIEVLESLASDTLKNNQDFQTQLEIIKPSLHYDKIFSASFTGRKVVLGYVFNAKEKLALGALPRGLGKIDARWKERLDFVSAAGYTSNLAILQDNCFGAGFFDNPLVDNLDGIFRRVPLLQEYEQSIYESLALAVTRAAIDANEITVMVENTGDEQRAYTAIEEIRLGNYRIPIDERAAVLVPYRGQQESFEYISAADIIFKRVPEGSLKNKIVLVGTTAPGLLDMRSTPVQNIFPGVEIHANIVSGILNQSIKHRPLYTQAFELSLLLVAGVIIIILFSALSPLWASVITVTALTIITIINMVAWDKGLVLPLASSLLLILCLFVLQMSYGFFIESRGKRVISKLFGQYIPPELVDEISENPQDINLDGESREMTVMFSDIRGFTTISEALKPKELTQLINEILTPLTRVIHKHRGTIDKYMGDAIMAFWGAPLQDGYHAKNALLAGLEMLNVIEELQPLFKKRGWPEIRIGIGMNTGLMNVGNMGSEFRMAYTVLGDAVNLGSRLEGLTKSYGVSIIVSEFIKEAVPEFEYLELDRVRVKGKDTPVNIYEPLGYSIDMEREQRQRVRRFNKALSLFRQQNWDAAEREIFTLAQSDRNKLIYKIYLDRIMYYRNHPPGENWDGVLVHTTK